MTIGEKGIKKLFGKLEQNPILPQLGERTLCHSPHSLRVTSSLPSPHSEATLSL